jgi:hypothetical protein
LSIFTTTLASRIGSWQHDLKISSIALQVSMTLVKTDLGFLHIIQRFKIVGRETNNNKGFVVMNRTNRTEQQPGMITEFTATLGYAYAF